MSAFESQVRLQDFFAEVEALEDFKTLYGRDNEFRLDREDQDVQRLIEAMAFYSARTRKSAERALQQYERRALERLFPYLLTPLPAMALLWAEPSHNLQDTRFLPRGAEFAMSDLAASPGSSALSGLGSAEAAQNSAPAKRLFRTLSALRLYPLRLREGSVALSKLSDTSALSSLEEPRVRKNGWKLTAALQASPRYFDDPERPLNEIELYFNPRGDTLMALRAFDAVQRSLLKVTCRFMEGSQELLSTETRSVKFGAKERYDGAEWDNPIERFRRLVHYPASEFCMRIPLLGAPSEWHRLELEFELDQRWPAGLALTDRSFLLNAVLVENAERRAAQPIEFDGQSARIPVDHPDPRTGMKLREVLGVYVSQKEAPGERVALLPSALAGQGYIAESEGRGLQRESWLELEVAPPKVVHVDADWYQPHSEFPAPSACKIMAETQDVGAVAWRIAEPLTGPKDSPVTGNQRVLSQVLEVQGKAELSTQDFKLLLAILGAEQSDIFSRIPQCIQSVSAELLPDARSQLGSLLSYRIVLKGVATVLEPAVRLLFSAVPSLLAAWTGLNDVRVKVALDDMPEAASFVFEWRATDG